MIRILGTLLAGLLGLAFGSFLNVCLSRWPEGESIVKPSSHCRNCGRTLAWWENVPVVSWVALRGRCRTCKARISWRYPAVELAVGGLWAFAYWHTYFALVWWLYVPELMLLLWALVALAVLDAEHLWIPDALTIPFTILGAIRLFLLVKIIERGLGFPREPWVNLKDAGQILLAIAVPAAIILLIRWTYWLVRRREGIGLGDAKLMAMLGAWLGLSGALLSFVIGVTLGAAFATVLLAIPSGRRGSETWLVSRLPLGTFLCAGGIISALWGQPIIAAYVRWAGL